MEHKRCWGMWRTSVWGLVSLVSLLAAGTNWAQTPEREPASASVPVVSSSTAESEPTLEQIPTSARAAVADCLPVPEFIDWTATTEQTWQLLSSPDFLSQFSMKRHYRLEPWLKKLRNPSDVPELSEQQDLDRMRNDVNRTLLEIWREQTLRPQFERNYAQGKPFGCEIVAFSRDVPLEFWLDALSMAAEIRVAADVLEHFPEVRWIQRSAADVYGLAVDGGLETDGAEMPGNGKVVPRDDDRVLPGNEADWLAVRQKNHPAVALLACRLSPETLKQAERLEKLGFYVDFISEEMLSRATVTLRQTGDVTAQPAEVVPPTEAMATQPGEAEKPSRKPTFLPVLGIGAMEYAALYVASDVTAIQPETDAFFQRLAKQGCPVQLVAKLPE